MCNTSLPRGESNHPLCQIEDFTQPLYLRHFGYTKITQANDLGDLCGGAEQGIRDVVQAVSNLTGLTIMIVLRRVTGDYRAW
jgi:hypothetical protein